MSICYVDIQNLWLELAPSRPLLSCIYVDVDQQKLLYYYKHCLQHEYPVSTAKKGLGCEQGSYQTPTGFHQIVEKAGDNMPLNMLFKARQATGKTAHINNEYYIAQDSITTRILWLSGLEKGINLGGNVDTKQRYIYIHGTADEAHLGQAVSHGCIRMANKDIVTLFQLVDEQTIVYIG